MMPILAGHQETQGTFTASTHTLIAPCGALPGYRPIVIASPRAFPVVPYDVIVHRS